MANKRKAAINEVEALKGFKKSDRHNEEAEAPVEIAVRKIKEMIYHHELVPGQKLLYKELATKLGMSTTPVIQALNRLQEINIVYAARNRGFYIGESNLTEARDLFRIREAMEIYLVPMIIKNMTDEKIKAIENAMKEHIKAVSGPEYRRMLMIKDTRFHLTIIDCAGSDVFSSTCGTIFEQIYLKYRPEYMNDARLKAAAEEHQTLLNALRERDVRKTKRLLKQHIKKGADHIVYGRGRGRSLEL